MSCLEVGLLTPLDPKRLQTQLFPLLREYRQYLQAEGGLGDQDISSCLGQTSVAAFLRSLALVAERCASPLLLQLCLLPFPRSYKCHSRWLGEAVPVITVARFA